MSQGKTSLVPGVDQGQMYLAELGEFLLFWLKENLRFFIVQWIPKIDSSQEKKTYSLRGIFWFPTIHIAWKPLIFKQHELSCSIIISSIAFVPLRLTAGTWLYGRWNLARFTHRPWHCFKDLDTSRASTQLMLSWGLDKCLVLYLLAFP